MNWPEEASGRHLLRIFNQPLRKQMYLALKSAVESALDILHPRNEVLALNGIERVLMLAPPDPARNIPHDPRILKVLEAIHEQSGRHWTVRELAVSVNMSEPNLARLFAKEVGISPIRYAEARRIDQAKALLMHSNDSISEIAQSLGYVDPYHFSNRFRVTTGKSPRAFRSDPSNNGRAFSEYREDFRVPEV
ncbi:MAG: AraC family transcriptional regulator [Chthoniobacterales bacterium]